MGNGNSREQVKRAADLAANQATEKAHAETRKQSLAQRAEFQALQQEQNDKLLDLQRQMERQNNDADKERLRLQMQHEKDLAARDQQVLKDAMAQSEKQMEMMRDQMRIQDERFERVQAQHHEEMQAYRENNKLDIEKLVATVKSLNDQMDDVVYDPKEPDKYNDIVEQNFDKFCAAASAHLKDVPKMSKKSVAVLGQSGTGKSTLLNIFAGKHVTKTGLTECTAEISMVHGDDSYDFYDVPGSHDARADFYNVEVLHKLKSLHLVLLVCQKRVDHVAKIAKLMVSINLPFIVVRNQCEFDKYSKEEWDEAKEEEMTKLRMYTKLEHPSLLFVGTSPDPKNGVPMEGFDELKRCMDAEMAKV